MGKGLAREPELPPIVGTKRGRTWAGSALFFSNTVLTDGRASSYCQLMPDRRFFEKQERQILAPYAAFSGSSRGRHHDEPEHPFRTAFQRDRDRVVHCTAFRRLEYKTQVFVNHEGDHYRTRLTHSLEAAIRVRGMGFTEPAAGKTGTDGDGWFAGYTSNLVCVAWVGFDDNTDLALEGAHSALPIWTEFMKRAHAMREYRNPEPFEPVDGIVSAQIDPDTNELATYACPNPQGEVFIAGSQPTRFCYLHGGGGRRLLLATNVAGWDSDGPKPRGAETNAEIEDAGEEALPPPQVIEVPPAVETPPTPAGQESEPKKGFFGRILDVFR